MLPLYIVTQIMLLLTCMLLSLKKIIKIEFTSKNLTTTKKNEEWEIQQPIVRPPQSPNLNH